MPYKVQGREVLHQVDGHWAVKQVARSHENALKAFRLLEGIEHGTLRRKL